MDILYINCLMIRTDHGQSGEWTLLPLLHILLNEDAEVVEGINIVR